MTQDLYFYNCVVIMSVSVKMNIPLDFVGSRLGVTMTHFNFFNLACLYTSLNPHTNLRLALA